MTSSYSAINLSIEGPAATIQLNRPSKRNAINLEMMREIEDALERLGDNKDVFGIIFTGGQDFFSSGMDLNVARAIHGVGEFADLMARWRRLNKSLEEHTKPIVAAIEGFCMTGGLELALACDIRYAGDRASFAITSSRIGTVAGAGATQRLPRIIGIPNALEMLFAAEPIDASRALKIGLVNQVYSAGTAVAEARRLVDVYSTRGPLALRFVKRAVYAGMQMPLSEAIEYEGVIVNTIYTTKDKAEGIDAFLEKRRPQFIGK